MMSELPIKLEKLGKKEMDMEILRVGIIAELDAINLYEQMAALADDKNIKKMLLDIAKEEKTHVGEFQRLLLNRDRQQVEELEKGKEEVRKETGE
jgi:rubrerythrin